MTPRGPWERAGRAAYLAFCAAVFVFLIAPIVAIVPLSFNAEPYFTFTEGMLRLDPRRLFAALVPHRRGRPGVAPRPVQQPDHRPVRHRPGDRARHPGRPGPDASRAAGPLGDHGPADLADDHPR